MDIRNKQVSMENLYKNNDFINVFLPWIDEKIESYKNINKPLSPCLKEYLDVLMISGIGNSTGLYKPASFISIKTYVAGCKCLFSNFNNVKGSVLLFSNQCSIADRSYTDPTHVDTGSLITSPVIEHINFDGISSFIFLGDVAVVIIKIVRIDII